MDYRDFLYDLEYTKQSNDMNNNDIIKFAEQKIFDDLIKKTYEYSNKNVKKANNLYEAFKIVDKLLSEEKKQDFFRPYIIAYMNIIKVFQSFYITWQILPGEEPEIVYDEDNNIESLITDEKYDSLEVIDLLIEQIEKIKNDKEKTI